MGRLIATLIVAILSIATSHAHDWRLIEANSVDIVYRSYMPGSRDPYVTNNGLPDRQIGKGLDFDIKNDIFWGLGYLDLLLHSKTDEDTKNGGGQFRSAGLQFRTGLNISDYVQIGYFHHSQHVFDTEYRPGFGVEDAIELKVNIFRRK